MITSSSKGTGMWLSLAVVAKLAAHYRDDRPVTIDRVSGQRLAAPTDTPLTARLLHDGHVVALVHDAQFAEALIALFDSIPVSLQGFANTFIDLLRQHTAEESTGLCRECGQPMPCGTRMLLQEKIGAQPAAHLPGSATVTM